MAKNDSKALAADKAAQAVVVSVGAASGENVAELAKAILGEQKPPFMASLKHKGFKPLMVPSTGINDLIPGDEPVEFKVKSFEQAWVVVTDLATQAKRCGGEDKDFAIITVAPAPVEPEQAGGTAGGESE